MSQLPVQPAWRLADCPEQQRWLVDGLWSEAAVGIIGGEPKCCKSFLALDLAVAVAAGIPCLRRFAVARPGRVLLYPAEDALHVVRRRIDGICAAAGINLAQLDVQVITAPSLRLDLESDRIGLDETIARLKPRLLILDPSCACIVSTKMSAAKLRHCSPSSANYSGATPSPSQSSTMPKRVPAPSAPVRLCADRPSSMPGAIPTSISAATATIASS
jgi:RecA-family ATPase